MLIGARRAVAANPWSATGPHRLAGVPPAMILDARGRSHLGRTRVSERSLITVTNASALRTGWGADGVLRLAAADTIVRDWSLGRPTLLFTGSRTNKVTARKHNPTGLNNVTKTGDAAAVLSVVDDAAALAAAGLAEVCTSGVVYKLDNSAGTTAAYAQFGGTTGNTNKHSSGAYVRGGTGQVGIGGVVRDTFAASAGYVLRTQVDKTPINSSGQFYVVADPGQILFFILPQLVESTIFGPIIPGSTTGATTIPADIVTSAVSPARWTAVALRGHVPAAVAGRIYLGADGGAKLIGSDATTAAKLVSQVHDIAAAALPGDLAVCIGWGASGTIASQAGAASTTTASIVATPATWSIGPSSGLAAGQILYIDQLVAWALPARPDDAAVRAQARAAM